MRGLVCVLFHALRHCVSDLLQKQVFSCLQTSRGIIVGMAKQTAPPKSPKPPTTPEGEKPGKRGGGKY